MSLFRLKSSIRIPCAKRTVTYLQQEVEVLGYKITHQDETGVEINGTLTDCMRLNLWLRTAYRVLFMIDEFEAATPDALYDNLVELPWEEYLPQNGYISIGSFVENQHIRDTRFANLKVKDAVVDRMVKKTGRRPDSGPENDKTVLFLFWKNNEGAIYIDTSGETIAKHAYRVNPFKAPMIESLAAAVVMATGWNGSTNFINPMCGSGTLAIEAALMASNVAPGLMRKNFGFMHIAGFNNAEWQKMRKEAVRTIKPEIEGRIIATDIDFRAIKAARANAEEAKVDHLIEFNTVPFENTFFPHSDGIIILNPEYGERLGEAEKINNQYKSIGDFFKQKGTGYMGYIFTGNLEAAKNIGLKTSRRIPFYNATIDCRLLEYELYSGSKIREVEF